MRRYIENQDVVVARLRWNRRLSQLSRGQGSRQCLSKLGIRVCLADEEEEAARNGPEYMDLRHIYNLNACFRKSRRQGIAERGSLGGGLVQEDPDFMAGIDAKRTGDVLAVLF